MKRLALIALCSVAWLGIAQAQTPFDMSPERPVTPATPRPTPPAPDEMPEDEPPAGPSTPAAPELPRAGEPDAVPAAEEAPPRQAQPPAASPPPQSSETAGYERHILPTPRIVLAGEVADRSWIFHLTERQAASDARLKLAYQNAVVAAPESSFLEVLLNGTRITREPISSADRVRQLDLEIPAGVMRAGRNEISMRAEHRHRTDCSIVSTYELWTEIRSSGTVLSFADGGAASYSNLADLRAIAPDQTGLAHIDIIAPSIGGGGTEATLMRLAQAIALQAGLPSFRFHIHDGVPDADLSGASLVILAGMREEFASEAGLPNLSTTSQHVGFLPGGQGEPPRLAVLGTTRTDLMQAVERLAASVDRPVATTRETLLTESWRAPNPPMLYDARSISFGELGIMSEQFSGRRYTRSFAIGVPSDFYAGSYGQARILLDAAYTDNVLPGSTINIYVNGSIASSTPITNRGGAILDRHPIKVTMRHFRPGLNDVVIEVDLLTEQDTVCLPGATADETPRFALFDSSTFDLPRYARIAERPNLDALSGTAFPYSRSAEPVPVVLERQDAANLSLTANVMARMAVGAGRIIPVEFSSSIDAIRDVNAIFIAPVGGIPASVLTQVGLDAGVTGWGNGQSTGANRLSVDRWREEMGGRGLGEHVGAFQDWLQQTFNITMDMLRFVPTQDQAFIAPAGTALVVAQELNPARNGVWTVFAGADANMLASATGHITDQQHWRSLSGRVTTLASDLTTTSSMPVRASRFSETQPASLANYRLIAANWLSTNILSYSLILVVICLVLGIATSALMSLFGRRH